MHSTLRSPAAPSPYHDDRHIDALAEALVDVWTRARGGVRVVVVVTFCLSILNANLVSFSSGECRARGNTIVGATIIELGRSPRLPERRLISAPMC